nr:uncharacterized protein LOC111508899 [Leptinotarsa decemlineata]
MFKYQVILCSFFGLCVAKQAKFTLCGFSGFSCSTIGDEPQTITYRCPSDQKDILLKINDFENPPNGVSLIIENCPEITVSFQCSSQVRYLQSLIIRNIGTLKIQQDPQYQTHLPLEVLLQNVTYIDEIPGFVFSQVNKVSHNVNCVRPEFDLKLLQFENVRIGTILANGIYMPKDAGNVVFSNVAIGRMKKDAILANMTISYIFQMEDSAVGMMENQAIQVSGKGMIFQ